MKIVICGNYGAQNIGDEMILEGLIQKLKSKYPAAEFLVISANPEETSKIHHVKSLKQLPAGIKSYLKSLLHPNKETIEAIKDCDLFIFGGGGLFASQSNRANLIWWLQTRPALKYKKTIEIVGQSLGAIKGIIEKAIIKKIFNSASKISVRDTTSKKNLEKVGIKRHIEVEQDLALYSKPKHIHNNQSKIVSIALRDTPQWPPTLKQDLTKICNWLIEELQLEINFVNFQQGPQSDNNVHEELLKGINQKSKVKIMNPKTTTEAEAQIANSKCLIGMRLHSVITAIKTKTPFLAISYGEKISNLLNDQGFSKNSLTLEKVTFNSIKDKLSSIFH